MRRFCFAAVVTSALLVAGCTSSSHRSPKPSNTASGSAATAIAAGPTGGTTSTLAPHRVIVAGRAAAPTQTTAPGLQFTQGSLSVTVAGHAISVPAEDWNTITGTSAVPHDIGLSLDADFHAADTSRNRFQYLADQMAQYAPEKFDPIGVVAEPVGKTLITIVALLNRTPNTYRLSDFQVTVTEQPPVTTVGHGTVFTGTANALVVPGQDVYFLRLSLPLAAAPPAKVTTTNYSFHYGSLYDCGTKPC